MLLFLGKRFSINSNASSFITDRSKSCINNMTEEFGAKKTEDGFYYIMDSNAIAKGFEEYYDYNGISKRSYKKYVKRYKNRTNCCYVLSYMGKKQKICLPKEIEGISNYVLCISDLGGWSGQVKEVTVPAEVKISSVLYDNPLTCLGRNVEFRENRSFDYKFHIEKDNPSLKSIQGMLCSKDKKTVYGVPSTIKGRLMIPDSVTEVHLPYDLSISELIIGKNVRKLFVADYREYDNLKKIRVKKGNLYYTAVDNTLYSKDMKKLFFSVSDRTGTYKMPKEVETMNPFALYHTKFSKIITSDHLKEIPKCAFYSNENLKELVIGVHVKKIGKSVVQYGVLNKITVKEGNKYFVEKNGHLYDRNLSRVYF